MKIEPDHKVDSARRLSKQYSLWNSPGLLRVGQKRKLGPQEQRRIIFGPSIIPQGLPCHFGLTRTVWKSLWPAVNHSRTSSLWGLDKVGCQLSSRWTGSHLFVVSCKFLGGGAMICKLGETNGARGSSRWLANRDSSAKTLAQNPTQKNLLIGDNHNEETSCR